LIGEIMKNRSSILIGICVVVIVTAFWYLMSSPLPSLKYVVKMTYTQAGQTWEVGPEHWPAIWKELLPARPDPFPSKWVVMGDLHLSMKAGDSYRITLYRVEGTGAFSAGTDWENRKYYRGGNSEQLRQVIERAKPQR
jgi:hypothetical protein